jgi:hypothetical protein
MNATSTAMVRFPVAKGEATLVERMHATNTGDGKYILRNSPFYAFGISAEDVFYATSEDGELTFSGVASRGGHSTYRVRLPAQRDHAEFLKNWEELERLGCTYEGSSADTHRLYTIDVPPTIDVLKVYRVLEEKEQRGIWVFEEAHYFNDG